MKSHFVAWQKLTKENPLSDNETNQSVIQLAALLDKVNKCAENYAVREAGRSNEIRRSGILNSKPIGRISLFAYDEAAEKIRKSSETMQSKMKVNPQQDNDIAVHSALLRQAVESAIDFCTTLAKKLESPQLVQNQDEKEKLKKILLQAQTFINAVTREINLEIYAEFAVFSRPVAKSMEIKFDKQQIDPPRKSSLIPEMFEQHRKSTCQDESLENFAARVLSAMDDVIRQKYFAEDEHIGALINKYVERAKQLREAKQDGQASLRDELDMFVRFISLVIGVQKVLGIIKGDRISGVEKDVISIENSIHMLFSDLIDTTKFPQAALVELYRHLIGFKLTLENIVARYKSNLELSSCADNLFQLLSKQEAIVIKTKTKEGLSCRL